MTPLFFAILTLAVLGYALLCLIYGLTVMGYMLGERLISLIPAKAKSPPAATRKPRVDVRH